MINRIEDVPNKAPEPVVNPAFMTLGPEPGSPSSGIVIPGLVEKRWGHEKLYANGDYCLKQLFIREGQCTSMHFHKDKTETLLVISGSLRVDYKNREGDDLQVDLEPGEAMQICPGFMHRLVATSDVIIVEGSTRDHPWDSFRVTR